MRGGGAAREPLVGAEGAADGGPGAATAESRRPPTPETILPFWTWPLRIACASSLLICTLPVWFYCLVTDTCRWKPFTTEEHRKRGRLVGWLTACCWEFGLRLCFWVRLIDGLGPLRDAGKAGRSIFLAINHVSMLDAGLVCTSVPRWMVGDLKALMSARYLHFPILGRLAAAVGHQPVPFRSASSGDFRVDKDKMQRIMDQIDDHIVHGGYLAVFPEGDLNKDWMTLGLFRAGGIEICIKHDMEVWGVVFAGNGQTWPVGVAVGGAPATIRSRAILLYPSAKEAAERLAGADADVRAGALAMADEMRTKMQAVLDELVAEGDYGGERARER